MPVGAGTVVGGAGTLLLAAAIAGFFLPDLVGILSGVLAASLFMAFAILGYAVLHTITYGMGSRVFLLAGDVPQSDSPALQRLLM